MILSLTLFGLISGGWQGRGIFKVTFNSGGAIEFAEHFRHAVASGKSSIYNNLSYSNMSSYTVQNPLGFS